MTIKTFPYLGNKGQLLGELLQRFPAHRIYCEPFGGSGAVLLNKPKAEFEIFNDLDRNIVSLYEVIRDEKFKSDEWTLKEKFKNTPYSYELVQNCRRFLKENQWRDDEIFYEKRKRAWAWAVSIFASMRGSGRSFQADPSRVRRFRKWIDSLEEINNRLQEVIIECRPWDFVVRLYDGKHTLFYMDPPYNPGTTHDKTHYKAGSFTIEDHKKLIEEVKKLQGTAIISGYKDPLYLENLHGIMLKKVKKRVSPKAKRGEIEEWIYSNKPIKNEQMSLF